MAVIVAEEEACGRRVELPGSWAKEKLLGCDLLAHSKDVEEAERVEVKGWGETMLSPRGRFTYGQDVRASQVQAVFSGVRYRLEIVGNLDAHLGLGEPYHRLTLDADDIKSRLIPRLYEVPLTGLEGRVRIGPMEEPAEESLPEPKVFDWPHPEPGPGMLAADEQQFAWPSHTREHIASDDLRASDVPSNDAQWSEIEWFAISFDGYAIYGNQERLGPVANLLRDYARRMGVLPTDANLDLLRGGLFYEHRRYRQFGHVPGASDVPYIRWLVAAIRELSVLPRR